MGCCKNDTSPLIDVEFECEEDLVRAYRTLPKVPRQGERVVIDGVRYTITEVEWDFGAAYDTTVSICCKLAAN